MKNFLAYLANVVLLGCMFTSCAQEDITTLLVGKDTYLSLEINSGQLASRATVEETETGIQTLDIFLYPNGATDEDAVLHVPYTLNTIDTDGTVTVPVKVSSSNVKSLFPDNAMTCTAYVLANKGDITLPSSTDMASLKGMAIQADFTKDQTSFVMDGSNQVTYDATLKKISGKVELVRAASKISLIVTSVTGQVEDDFGNKWKSDPSQMKVGFYNGVKKTNVDVTYENCQYTVTDGDYFNITNRALSGTNEYTHTKPFYSYSSAWESGSATASYLILVLPWQKLDEQGNPIGDYMPCYYQVPINETNKKIERNHYYEIKLSVGILGSFTPDEPLVVDDASYVVLDWSEALTSAELKEYRYLVVDKNFVEMDNVEELRIAFSTSHEAEIVNAKLTKPVLNPLGSNDATIAPASYQVEIESDSKGNYYIRFNHELDNERSNTDKNYDYVPYTLELDIRHKDNLNFVEHVTIVQYPAMYVVGSLNSDYNTNGNNNNYHGGVYINGVQNNSGANYGGAYHLGSATNANPNMYVITTTAFDESSNYVLGDSRKNTIDLILSNNSNWSTTAPAYGESSNRQLRYYYPTDNSSNTENMVAPKFRVASSYGVAVDKSYDDMRRRCASYQEDGFPAGRWRMPTKAEVEYIVRLSAEGKIPKLFNDEKDNPQGDYWCAHGVAYPQSNGTVTLTAASGEHSVRCVYDDWYWGSSPVVTSSNRSPFTWGDKEITW